MNNKSNFFRIAALCATPRYMNTGMLCVDQSLKELLCHMDVIEHTQFYCFDTSNLDSQTSSEIDYKSIYEMSPYEEYDLIIIWGDFVVTRKWMSDILPKLKGMSDQSDDENLKMIEHRVLLSGCSDEIFEKTIIFGQNLMVDGSDMLGDKRYRALFTNLLTKVALARFRDPLSAYRAGILSGKPAGLFMGVDAALLLSSLLDMNDKEIKSEKQEKYIGVFYCRTVKARLTKLLISFQLRQKCPRVVTRWMPWLQERKNPGSLMKLAYGLKEYQYPTNVVEFIKAIRGAQFLVADTYHICLVAWSFGVPAICIGNGTQPFARTIDDKKKEVFFHQHYLSELYIFNELGWGNLRSGKISHAIDVALKGDVGLEVKSLMQTVINENIEYLKQGIKRVLKIN